MKWLELHDKSNCKMFILFFSASQFCFRTSAAENFPVVVTELTFPSVTVESVPFAIQTGKKPGKKALALTNFVQQ